MWRAGAIRPASPSAPGKATVPPPHPRRHLPPSLNRIDIQSKCQSSLFSLSASSPPGAAFRGLSLVTDEDLSHPDTQVFTTCDNARASNHLEVKHSALRSAALARQHVLSAFPPGGGVGGGLDPTGLTISLNRNTAFLFFNNR